MPAFLPLYKKGFWKQKGKINKNSLEEPAAWRAMKAPSFQSHRPFLSFFFLSLLHPHRSTSFVLRELLGSVVPRGGGGGENQREQKKGAKTFFKAFDISLSLSLSLCVCVCTVRPFFSFPFLFCSRLFIFIFPLHPSSFSWLRLYLSVLSGKGPDRGEVGEGKKKGIFRLGGFREERREKNET